MLDVRLGSFGNPSLTRQGGRDAHAGTNMFRAHSDAAMHKRWAPLSLADCAGSAKVCAAAQHSTRRTTCFEIVMLVESQGSGPAPPSHRLESVLACQWRDRDPPSHDQGTVAGERRPTPGNSRGVADSHRSKACQVKLGDRTKKECGGGGAWGRIRTTDTRIFNPLLYQLSYPGLVPPAREPRL